MAVLSDLLMNSENAGYSDVILEHYRKEAEEHGKDASSTMRDEITRGREVASVLRVLESSASHLITTGLLTGPMRELMNALPGSRTWDLEVLTTEHQVTVGSDRGPSTVLIRSFRKTT